MSSMGRLARPTIAVVLAGITPLIAVNGRAAVAAPTRYASDPVNQNDRPFVANHPKCHGPSRTLVPSCRFKNSVYTTWLSIKFILGTSEFSQMVDANSVVPDSGSPILATEFRQGGPWDEKVILAKFYEDKSFLPMRPVCIKRSNGKCKGELGFFSRITKNRAIYYNVFGNVVFGYIGLKANFDRGFLETFAKLEHNGKLPGNTIERSMGYHLFSITKKEKHPTQAQIIKAILWGLGRLRHYSDAPAYPMLKFPPGNKY